MSLSTSPRFALDSEVWRTTTGAQYIEALARGEVPRPRHVDTLSYDFVSATPGAVEFRWTPGPELRNRAGFAQGGFVVAVLDEASTYAAASNYARFVPQMTVDLRTDFLRPVAAESVVVRGTVVKMGRMFSTVQARVLDDKGRELALLTSTVIANRGLFPEEVWAECGL